MVQNRRVQQIETDFLILHVGLCDAVICTSLSVEEATRLLNARRQIDDRDILHGG